MIILGLSTKSKGNNLQERYINYVPRHGIYDRNNVLLADNIETFSLYTNPKDISRPAEAAKVLTEIFPDLNFEHLLKQFYSKKSFIWIKRHLTPADHMKVLEAGEPGIYIIRDEKRIYPLGNLFSHILGSVDISGEPLSGLEKYLDSQLRVGSGSNGALYLSLDSRVQYIVHSVLGDYMRKFSATGAAGIILDAKNGEIISMVSLPDFDPNKFVSDDKLRFNRAIAGVYELGSVMKSFTMAAAIDTKSVRVDEEFSVSESLNINSRIIKDYTVRKEPLRVSDILVYSSNVGMVKMLLKMGLDRQKLYLDKMGLTGKIDIELFETARPLVPRKWNEIAGATISYGYGLAVTPLHVAYAMSVLANRGCKSDLTLLLRNQKGNSADDNSEFVCDTRIFSEDTAEKMKNMLYDATKRGTGKRAFLPEYGLAGKTGTANKIINGSYDSKTVILTFAAMFPVSDPHYVIVVVIDEPKRVNGHVSLTSSAIAAPAVNEIVKRAAPALGLLPSQVLQ